MEIGGDLRCDGQTALMAGSGLDPNPASFFFSPSVSHVTHSHITTTIETIIDRAHACIVRLGRGRGRTTDERT